MIGFDTFPLGNCFNLFFFFLTFSDILCPAQLQLDNGQFWPKKHWFKIGEEQEFSCREGLTLSGSAKRNCTKWGHWTGTLPVCIDQSKHQSKILVVMWHYNLVPNLVWKCTEHFLFSSWWLQRFRDSAWSYTLWKSLSDWWPSEIPLPVRHGFTGAWSKSVSGFKRMEWAWATLQGYTNSTHIFVSYFTIF